MQASAGIVTGMLPAAAIEALRPRFGMAGTAAYRPGATFGPHTLQSWELFWLLDGTARWTIDGVDERLRPGVLACARPGQRHAIVWDARVGGRHGFVHFAAGALPALPALLVPAPGWEAVAQRLLAVLRQRAEGWEPHARQLLRTLLLFAAVAEPEHHPSPPLPDPLTQVLRAVENRLARTPAWRADLPALAHLARVAPRTLDRWCRAATGHPPMRLVRLLRLERAAYLLVQQQLPAADVGRRCGFASAPHFNRVFRAVWGRSPAALRRHVRAGGTLPSGPLTRIRVVVAPHGAATPPP